MTANTTTATATTTTTTPDPNASASKAQTFAIFCAGKLDVRSLEMTREEASATIQALNGDSKDATIKALIIRGAVDKKATKAATTTTTKGTKATKSTKSSKGSKATTKDSGDNIKPPKATKDDGYADLYKQAHQAGMQASRDARPEPMVVAQHANVLDDSSPVVKTWDAPEGVCGFAWLVIRPGTQGFARWINRNNKGKSSTYHQGTMVFAGGRTQSMERNQAYVRAFGKVITDAGIKCQSYSRMD